MAIYFIVGVGLFFVSISAPPVAHAIVLIPALLLIPIVKIVAIFIASMSLPAATAATLWSYTHHKSRRWIIITVGVILITLAILVAVVLKLAHPERPWF